MSHPQLDRRADFHKDWEVGGPSALLGEWWVREHWGRAFEILRFFDCPDDWFTHDFVVMRKLDVSVTAEELEAVDPRNPREYASVSCNLEILQRQQKALGEQLRDAQRGGPPADLEAQQLQNSELVEAVQHLAFELERRQAEIERLNGLLSVIAASRSWRLTAPLRRARTIAGKRR